MPRLLQITTASITLKAFLLPHAAHFRSQGWTVHALANGAASCDACNTVYDRTWDISWSRNPLAPGRLIHLVRYIRQLVEKEQYDIVHVHTPIAAFVTRFALRALRRRGRPVVVYTAHGFHFIGGGKRLRNAAFLSLEKLAGRWTDFLVVINQEDRKAAIRHGIVPPSRVRYIPGVGIDLEQFSPEAVDDAAVERVRAEMGLAPGQPLLVMAAEFNRGKRHADAVRALAGMARTDAHLALAGDGPLMPEIKRLAAEMGVQDRVHLLGFREDVPALIRASRACVLPSEREGLPRSIMEALSLEVPVVAANIRGVRELVDRTCGLLVDTGDVAALGRAMDFMVDEPEPARRMGRAGREKMKRFGLQQVLALHEELYQEALQSTAGDGLG